MKAKDRGAMRYAWSKLKDVVLTHLIVSFQSMKIAHLEKELVGVNEDNWLRIGRNAGVLADHSHRRFVERWLSRWRHITRIQVAKRTQLKRIVIAKMRSLSFKSIHRWRCWSIEYELSYSRIVAFQQKRRIHTLHRVFRSWHVRLVLHPGLTSERKAVGVQLLRIVLEKRLQRIAYIGRFSNSQKFSLTFIKALAKWKERTLLHFKFEGLWGGKHILLMFGRLM